MNGPLSVLEPTSASKYVNGGSEGSSLTGSIMLPPSHGRYVNVSAVLRLLKSTTAKRSPHTAEYPSWNNAATRRGRHMLKSSS